MGYWQWADVPSRNQFTVLATAANNEDQLLYDQRGPTCGIYGLWKALERKGANPPPPTKSGVHPVSLRSLAKSKGLTQIGELFDANQVPALARLAGYKGCETFDLTGFDADTFYYMVRAFINADRFVMIAFSVDTSTGEPSRSGLNPHWCLLFGYREADKTLLATHWNMFFVFRAVDLWDSNNVLQDFPKSTWGKLKGKTMEKYNVKEWYDIRSYKNKVNFPRTDLAHTLGWKLVVI